MSTKTILSAFFLITIIITCCNGAGNFNIRDYGAVADSNVVNTKAVQKAIDQCSAAGGGNVLICGGKFTIGTIILKNNVTLHISKGSSLQASTNLKDFEVKTPNTETYNNIGGYSDKALIYAEKQENIGIEGAGTIDGNGDKFGWKVKERPRLIQFSECKNVAVKDVLIKDSAFWVQHYLKCENVLIDGLTIHSRANSNNDGIDIDSCNKVRISNCEISSEDDAIVLKSTSKTVCKNVTISNCILSSHCNAIKCGTESNGGFENIVINNCCIYDTRISGIALEVVDGGKMDGVCISNITMNNVKGGIFIRLGGRGRGYKKDMPKQAVGILQNVTISNIEATGIGDIGLSITGLPGHLAENITLSNIRISYLGNGKAELAQKTVAENPEKYPEYWMFGALPSYGFYCRHIKNLKMHNLDLSFKSEDNRPALIFDDVKELDIFGFRGQMVKEAISLIWLKNVKDAFVHGCKPGKDVKTFLRIDGVESGDICVMNNDFWNVEKAVEMGKDIEEEAVFVKFNRVRN